MGWIYKITNLVNGKMYIGKTECIDPYQRWKTHLEDSKKKSIHRPLYNAMQKYGTDNFEFEVIQREDNSDKLCELEKYYIQKYNTYVRFDNSNGYNATLGGDGRAVDKLDEQEVIQFHISHNYITGETAKYYNVDRKVIQKILFKHNIPWLTHNEIVELKFLQNYGGIVEMSEDKSKIEFIYTSPKKVIEKNSQYNYHTLTLAYTKNSKTHFAYGHYWYRLNELPEEYKPLLELYYKDK